MAGTRGPIPKRSDQKHGHRTKAELAAVTKVETQGVVADAPAADESWHPIALAWYESLRSSGQAVFYQPSDWATAVLVAESMSRDLRPQVVGITDSGMTVTEVIPLKGASLGAYLRAFGVLMVTEGDRRRLQIELSAPKADADLDAADGVVTSLMSRLGG